MQIEATSPEGRIGAAETLLKEMKTLEPPLMPNVRTHMVLIEGHGKQGRLEDAVAAWQRMLQQGLKANEYVYTALIDACAKRMDVDTADRILEAALEDTNMRPNIQMFTAMIDMNARAGRAGKIKSIWRNMLEAGVSPDTIAVNAAITALEKSASLQDAMGLFEEIQSTSAGRSPQNSSSY
jgi:pentatricopeptide repeat protein